jgi:protein gp37
MGENSPIEWTDHTFNPWWGCAKVSPGCDHCYAERDAGRYQPGRPLWGVDAERRTFGEHHWNEPLRWERKAVRENRRLRVFCASMADVFDKNAPEGARERLWAVMKATPHLDWLVLTKRIGNAARMLPADWGAGYPNVWLGISVVNQEEAERDVPKLGQIPAAIRFLSCEPLLGPISFEGLWVEHANPAIHENILERVHWMIVGGESGGKARPMDADWADRLRRQCESIGVAFFMKQGSQANWPAFKRFDLFPASLQVRQWPRASVQP